MRRANKTKQKQVPNFVPWEKLSKHIRDINIGKVKDISEFTKGVDEEEVGPGCYRPFGKYALRLAEHYIRVDKNREDKLREFPYYAKKDPSSILFLLAIGGDGAPAIGTSYLASFLNAGKRVASSSENFLIFGADVKEDGKVVKNYLASLVKDLEFLESKVHDVTVDTKSYKVEFKVAALPNDLKNLAFLAGELNMKAKYPSTFGNVSSDDMNKHHKVYGKDWLPFDYDKRLADADKVRDKKKELLGKNFTDDMELTEAQRRILTPYIASLESRQEFKPLVKEFIKIAKVDCLHLKNNAVKVQFDKCLQIVIEYVKIPKGVRMYKRLDDNNLFVFLVAFVRKMMKCGSLSKKLIRFFESDPSLKSNKPFDVRFTGRESFMFLQFFPLLIDELKSKVPLKAHQTLCAIFHQTLLLRQLVSYSVRIDDISFEDVEVMRQLGRQLFKSYCFYDDSMTPSQWTFTNVAPYHCKELLLQTGMGLGVNTMEGREQKHQQLRKYSTKATFQNKWFTVFRHEFIHNVYLKEESFDTVRYKKKGKRYVPVAEPGQCNKCCLVLSGNVCAWCDSPDMIKMSERVSS